MYFDTSDLVFELVFLVAGGYFLWLGLRGLIQRRPFLIPARQIMWFLLLCYVPQLLNIGRTAYTFITGSSDNTLVTFQGLNFVLFLVLVVVFWRQIKGYIAFGITDESFQDALKATFRDLDTPYEETVSSIKVPAHQLDLHVAVTEWSGTAQIRIKRGNNAPFFASFIQLLNTHLNASQGNINRFVFVIYTVLGIFLIGFGIAFAMFIFGRYY